MPIPEKLPLFRKLYAFTVCAHRSIHNMPREYRYTLGAEMARISWQCLDLMVLASYAEKELKRKKISDLSDQFDRLNLRVRLMQELNIISAGQFAHWQENYLLEIGCEIGGWSRWAASRQTGQVELGEKDREGGGD